MEVQFDQLPNEAKVWMYQASTHLTEEHKQTVYQLVEVFLGQWESHGIPVQGAVDVLNNRFIRIAAYTNEDSMCGRAQDAQVRLAKELETELGLELTNRMLLAFEVNNECQVFHMNDLENEIKKGSISAETTFYNNLVQSKSDFETTWKQPANKTWVNRYF